MNYLEEYGGTLIEKGYSIVPITEGKKFPKGLKGWQNERATHKTLSKWVRMGFPGVGILSRHCVGVDLDIYDADVCRQMRNIVVDILGQSLERVGMPPKTLLPYRVDTPFCKVQSKRYKSPDGQIHKVEILGEGQQWVAYAIHPETGKPYFWEYNGKPCEGIWKVRFDTLPTITEAQAREIVRIFEANLPDDWREYTGDNGAGAMPEEQAPLTSDDSWLDKPTPASGKSWENPDSPRDGDAFGNEKPPLGLTEEEMTRALDVIPADDYDQWITVGMGINHEHNGSPDGLDMWDKWSSKSSKYAPELIQEKWNGLRVENGRAPVTFATVLKMASDSKKRNQKKPASLLIDYVDMEDLEPPKYLIEKYIEEDTTGVFFGDPGSYKSFLALDISLCVATGKNWHGCPVRQCPVIYIAGEGRAGIKKRVAVWKKNMGLEVEKGQFFISTQSISLYDQESAEQLKESIEEIIKCFGKPSLIVIDTLARAFSPGDENSTADMGKFINHINKYLREPLGCVVLMVHHSGHTHKQRPRGAMALTAGIDFEYRIEKPKDLVAKMICTKMKDAEEPTETWFQGEEVVLNIFDDSEVKSLVFEKIETPKKEETRIGGNQKKLYDLANSMKNSEGCVNRKELRERAMKKSVGKDSDQVKDLIWKLGKKGLFEVTRTEIRVL